MSDSWIRDDQHTLVELLGQRLDRAPDEPYLDVTGSTFTAAEVADQAGRIANGLRHMGVSKGDRVAALIDNSPEALLTWWGSIWAGAVAVPVNTAYKGEYLRHQLADSGPGSCSCRPISPTGPSGSSPTSTASTTSWSSATARSDFGSATTHTWDDAPRARARRTGRRRDRATSAPSSTPAARPGRRRAACSATTTTRCSPDRSACAGGARPTTSCGRRCRCSTSTRSSPPCSGRCSSAGAARSTADSRCPASGPR